ncbi:MAG: motility associated factor glycosyltransferase family protein [Epulopiscium sp.]|nr:motility associated factor glycosyltransferase family protein [Candidatus Epulonipiscium sp.]
MKKDVKLIIYPPSLKTIPKGSENIRFILEDWNITKSETDEWRERVDENYERNKALNVPSVGGLYNRYKGLPFIIVSAGPSLEKNIHLLSDLEGRAFIFAVGRTLKTLLWENIEPDMFCIIDPQYEPTYSQISGYENLDIPMVFFESASADTISKYKGPKYIASDKKEHVENPEHIMDLGGSVATAILDLSIRFGGNPIVFVGQDLAFTDGQSHAYGNTVNESTNRRKVKGQNGEWLDTTLGLLSFKHWIENKIKDNPQIEFINATEGGAFIEGCKHMPLQNFIDQYIDYSKPVDQRLRQRKFKEEIKIFTATIEFIE